MKLRIPVLFACATLALTACSDDGGTNPRDLDRGEFRGTVRGDISASLDGDAFSGDSPNFSLQDEIVLEDVQEGITIGVAHVTDSFTEGRESLVHAINDDDGPYAFIIFEDEQRVFISTRGSGFIDVDEVTTSGIKGTLEFTAREVNINTGQPITGEVRVDVTFSTEYDTDCCGILENRSPLTRVTVNKTAVK